MPKLKTELTDRILRFDGVSEIHPDEVARYLLLGVPAKKLRVTEPSADLEQYNHQVPEEDQVALNTDASVVLNMDWNVPEPWRSLDLEKHVVDLYFKEHWDRYTKAEDAIAIQRMADELEQVEERGMVEFMRTVIYILHVLRENNVVWGVGRGSSCASYLLFLVGLHVVDCVEFEVPMEEFFHE